MVNFVSERAFVLSCGVHEMEDGYVHTTMSRSVSSSSNKSNVDDDQTMTKEDASDDDDMVSSKVVDGGGNPDLTMLLQKKGKTFLARTFLPKTQRQCVLNDYSFSFGRATYNVTAHASKTVIPLFMIWKIECVETHPGKGKELYDITIHLRHDRPKDNMYKKSFFSFIMKANKNDADRRNEEFQRRLACLCKCLEVSKCRSMARVGLWRSLEIVFENIIREFSRTSAFTHSQPNYYAYLRNNVRTTGGEKDSRVPPFPDILDDLRTDGDDSSKKIDDKSGTRDERKYGYRVDQDGYFS